MYRRLLAAGLVWAALLAAAGPARAQRKPIRDVTDDDVDRAIGRTIRYIKGRQRPNGLWPHHYQLPGGGTTALCLFALLEAGENPQTEHVRNGIDALIKVKTNHLYVRALRVMVLAQAGGRTMPEKHRKTFVGDLKWLTGNAAGHGAWSYGGPDRTGDNSCSQFALLALWEAIRAREELRPALVRAVERTWIRRQIKGPNGGGWTYAGTVGTKGDPTASMTAAGIASMYVCQDALVSGACRPYANREVIQRGMAWLAARLKPDYIHNGYLAFCVQRVGMASGLKFIGTMDWYAVGAKELVKPQPYGSTYSGQWGPDVRAPFELIFLARGRIPLVFNKLAHGGNTSGWDMHPRDIAQFAEYMRRSFEERMRWQIVDIADDMRLLLDAPILLVTATKPLELTEQQWAKLREYSLRGGTLLFMPVHTNKAYIDAVRDKLPALYAAQHKEVPKYYTLEQIPSDDEIYKTYKPIAHGEKALPMWGISDGTRWIAILSRTDLCCTWQRYQTLTLANQFDLGVNLYFYTTSMNKMGSRMRPVFVGSDKPVRGTVKVGWVRHDGNWNTQPFALEYLSQKLAAENRLGIDLTRGVVVGQADLKPFSLLWMTGTDEFTFTDAQVAALRKYLDGNGTIFVNAIGGSPAFMAAVEKLLAALSRGRDGLRIGLPSDSPLMNGKLGEYRGLPIEESVQSEVWKLKRGRVSGSLEAYVEGDAPRVVIARHGVHDTLDGHTTWSAMSYVPASSGQIAANVVLYSIMDRPAPPIPPPPTTQPEPATTQPAPAVPTTRRQP